MLRDDSSSGPGRRRTPRNVLGEPLEACSIKPMMGVYHDGCCNTGREDVGISRSRNCCRCSSAMISACGMMLLSDPVKSLPQMVNGLLICD
jgi:hypothetical protein